MLASSMHLLPSQASQCPVPCQPAGLVAIVGTTYTGHYYDMPALDKAVGEMNARSCWQVGIHVDGASGGFVAPFLLPDWPWDFRLGNVVSAGV